VEAKVGGLDAMALEGMRVRRSQPGDSMKVHQSHTLHEYARGGGAGQ
jgi:hypothetical protein